MNDPLLPAGDALPGDQAGAHAPDGAADLRHEPVPSPENTSPAPRASAGPDPASDSPPDSAAGGVAEGGAARGAPADSAEGTKRPRRRRGSRGGRRRRAAADRGTDADGGAREDTGEDTRDDRAEDASRDTAERPAEADERPRRKRGRRRRRGDDEPQDEALRDEPRDEPGQESREEPESSEDDSSDDSEARPRKRRRRGGRRRSRASRTEDTDDDREPAEASDDEPEAEEGGSTRPRRRRRKTLTSAGEGDDAAAADDDGDDADAPPKRRRRGSRGGRGRKKAGSKSDDGPKERSRRGGAVVVDAIPGEEDDLGALDELTQPAKKKRTRSRRTSEAALAAAEDARTQSILVNATQPDEVRVAVTEGTRILDYQMTVNRYHSLVNDIYRGRVVNIEDAIGAAFIDFGQGRNGFLHASDVLSAYGEDDWQLDKLLTTRVDDDWNADAVDSDKDDPKDDDGKKRSKKAKGKKRTTRGRARSRRSITDLFKKGQMVAVQITKDAIGDKGPTLTTYISIPGRYLVLMPSLARTGVSRKIEDDKERKRLKRILAGLDIPDGMGVIVRTAGIGKTKTDLRRDLDYLMAVWDDFGKRLVSGRNPAPLYQESSVAIRTMRDLFSTTTKEVVVDDPEVHAEMVEFAERLMPEHTDRIKLHDGSRPLYHAFGIEQEFERMFARRVELPSGGSIVVDQTEALVAIDVNSGRTREDGAGFEDIALKTNLEAAPEIARQIRLRDMGGILVLDFIDMMRPANRRAVEKAFRDALSTDRARSKVGRISQFGLLEMTRQRLGPGLSKLIFDPCPTCRGSGRQRTSNSRAIAILRRIGSALTQKGFSTVEVRAHPEVIRLLESHFSREIDELTAGSNRELMFTEVPDQLEDSVLRYLRADGREVRPGGRRKR